MPDYRHELELALKEGVRVIEKAIPKAFVRDPKGRLTGLQLQNGQELAADLVVLAIGQARLGDLAASFPGVALDPKGLVTADPRTGRTGNPKVYVGGDASSGGELGVNAAPEGKRAARPIAAGLGLQIRVDGPL